MTIFELWCNANGFDPKGEFEVIDDSGMPPLNKGDKFKLACDDNTTQPHFRGVGVKSDYFCCVSIHRLSQRNSESVDELLTSNNSTMTIRDQFAMSALSGLLARTDYEKFDPDEWANQAYKIADAMLEARK